MAIIAQLYAWDEMSCHNTSRRCLPMAIRGYHIRNNPGEGCLRFVAFLVFTFTGRLIFGILLVGIGLFRGFTSHQINYTSLHITGQPYHVVSTIDGYYYNQFQDDATWYGVKESDF